MSLNIGQVKSNAIHNVTVKTNINVRDEMTIKVRTGK